MKQTIKRSRALIVLLAVSLLVNLGIVCVAAEELTPETTIPENAILSQNFNVSGTVAANGGSLLAEKSGEANCISGYSVEVKTGKNTSISRGTKLMPIDTGGKALAAGNYTLSVWLRHNSASSGDWITYAEDVKSSLYIKLYNDEATDSAIQYNHQALEGRLLKVLGDDADFEVTEDTVTTGGKTWYRYEVSFTTAETYTQFAVWLVNSEVANAKDYYVYIDNLYITGTPYVNVYGTQRSDAVTSTFGVRIIGTLNREIAQTKDVGFRIAIQKPDGTSSAEKTVSCPTVYTSVLGKDENGNSVAYTNTALKGDYLFALTVTEIPTAGPDGNYVFTVTPYFKDADGNTVYGITVQSTYSAVGVNLDD